jgi:hypothetical protein
MNEKLMYFNENIYRHNHPANVGGFMDEQLVKTESFAEADRRNYEQRLINKFQ